MLSHIFDCSRARRASRLLPVVVLPLLAARANALEPVTFGDVIDSPGLYFLLGDQDGSGDGIRIESDNVTLLMLGYELAGDGSGNGISWEGYDRVHILGGGGRVVNFESLIEAVDSSWSSVKELKLRGGEDGLDCDDVHWSYFGGLDITRISGNGIELEACTYNTLVNNKSYRNGDDGIHIGFEDEKGGASHHNTITGCTANYNGQNGIRLLDASDNTLIGNWAYYNEDNGIYLDTGDDVLFGADSGDGSDNNTLKGNACHLNNRHGIKVANESRNNRITRCTALFNNDEDLYDDNDFPPCYNFWGTNIYLTDGGNSEDCI